MHVSYTVLRNLRFADREVCDLLFEVCEQEETQTSNILEIAPYIRTDSLSNLTQIDASALFALPPFFDLHTHVPYRTKEDSLQERCRISMASGGFDRAVAVLDAADPDLASAAFDELTGENELCRFYATLPPPKEKIAASVAAAKEAGAIAICDHASPLLDTAQLVSVMKACAACGLPYFADLQDPAFPRGGANSESLAQKCNLPYSPAIAESAQVAKLLAVAKATACPLHLQLVTCAPSLAMIRQAKAQGMQVTCETAPAYFTLTQNDLRFFGEAAHLDPPLRTLADRQAVLEAVIDGTIDAIVSANTPFAHPQTGCESASAETAFALSYMALVRTGHLTLSALAQKFCDAPCKIASLPPPPPIAVGEKANFPLFCYFEEVLQPHHLRSGSTRSAFLGQGLCAMVGAMVKNGSVTALLQDAIVRIP